LAILADGTDFFLGVFVGSFKDIAVKPSSFTDAILVEGCSYMLDFTHYEG